MKLNIDIKADDYVVAVGSMITNSKIEKVKEIKYITSTNIKIILESGISIDHYWFDKKNPRGWPQFRIATQEEISKHLTK